MIDQASVFAERFRSNPQVLQATVLGQGNIPGLDPYTALNALRLIKESDAMQMAAQAQQPTSSPSIVAQNMAPPPMQQGLGAMVPNTMGQAPQGQAPQAPQAPVMQASGGLAGMPVPEEDYAAGGIVAFAKGDLVGDGEGGFKRDAGGLYVLRPELNDSGNPAPSALTGANDANTDAGTGSATAQFNSLLMQEIANIQKKRARKTDPAEQEALRAKFLERETINAGPDIYGPEIARGAQEDADRAKRRNTGEAMALLTAAGAVLKGRSLSEGASNALPAYAGAMGEVDRADQAMKTANAKMQFALKDAQRKERMGNLRAADASMENYRKFQQDENKAEFDRDNAVGDLAAKGITGNRVSAKGAGAGPKYQEQILQNYIDYYRLTLQPKRGETPEAFDARVRKTASDEAATRLKTSFSTSSSTSENAPGKQAAALAPVIERIDAKVAEKLDMFKRFNTPYKKALRTGDTAEAQRLLGIEETAQRKVFERSESATGGRGGASSKPTTKIRFDKNGNEIQ